MTPPSSPSHINGGMQVPQSSSPPQGFGAVPQFCPSGHDGGVQPMVVVVVSVVVVVVVSHTGPHVTDADTQKLPAGGPCQAWPQYDEHALGQSARQTDPINMLPEQENMQTCGRVVVVV